MILSASRRTDIPSFYSQWFMNRLKEGYVLTRNPMNLSQISRVILSPELIDCIIFWTKDPENMMDKLPQLEAMGYHYYFQFTLTPYGRDIERNLRDKKDIRNTFRQLSERIGRQRVIWRYDPIILNEEYSMDYHIKSFTELCDGLSEYTKSCTISFVDVYSKISKQVKDNVIKVIPEEQMHQLAAELSRIGRMYEIELQACCEKLNLSEDGIKSATCIDKVMVERICGHSLNIKKDKNQREGCGCSQSVDIGVYNTCMHGCIYCYANHSDSSIYKNWSQHNPNSDILTGKIDENSKIKDRK